MYSTSGAIFQERIGSSSIGGYSVSYKTRVDLKETLFAILSLSNNLPSEICDCFLSGETLRNNDYFFPSFVIYS
jgi:hypothetical protein